MKKFEQYLHSSILAIDKYFPNIFKLLDGYRDKLNPSLTTYANIGLDLTNYINYVYLSSFGISCMLNFHPEYSRMMNNIVKIMNDDRYSRSLPDSIYFIYNWRANKKVYKFDDKFANIICNKTDISQINDLNVIGLLLHLPYSAFAVNIRLSDNICGFICAIDYNIVDGEISLLLKIMHIYDNMLDINDSENTLINIGSVSTIVMTKDTTIGTLIETTSDYDEDDIPNITIRTLYAILYMISLNNNADNKNIAEYKMAEKSSKKIKDRLKDITTIEVLSSVDDNILDAINDGKIKAHYEYSIIEDKYVFDWVIDRNTTQVNDTKRLIEEINNLKISNNNLKIDYENTKLELDRYKAMYEELQKSIEQERQQLYDLRKSIFDYQENGTSNVASLNITFPYKPSKRIVVFGGHDSWSKEIKPKLIGVRFVDRHMPQNPDMIKYADEVWIQNNSLSHSAFYAIMNNTRKLNIPVKYFSYASAIKCAEQLVKDDMGIK